MVGPRSEYTDDQKLLIQQLHQNKLPWPEVKEIFNATYPLEYRSEDVLRKVHSRSQPSPTSSSNSAETSRKIEFTAIYTPDHPPSRCRSHESKPTRQPTKPLNGTKCAEIEKNLREMEEILSLHEDIKSCGGENGHSVALVKRWGVIEAEK